MYIVLSRTDNLGDVVLSLPAAGVLKEALPGVRIGFVGKPYTRPIIEACRHVDVFLDRQTLLDHPAQLADDRPDAIAFLFPDRALAALSRRVGVARRVGTSHRWFHWRDLNRRVSLSRRRSDLHEAQLNVRLLAPLGVRAAYTTDALAGYYGLTAPPLPERLAGWFGQQGRATVVLHPKSKGSAREWPAAQFAQLARLLPADRYQLLLTGTANEGEAVRRQAPALAQLPHVADLTGRLSLSELMSVLAAADGLVAASTGPLHLSAALGRTAVGLYPPVRPIHPGRWAPLGPRAGVLVRAAPCPSGNRPACRSGGPCGCLAAISPTDVRNYLEDQLAVVI